VRLEQAKLCLLVLIGVRADGRKELVALADGYREATESWADLLRDCKRRGMRAPVLAVGDGALGFWGALREAFPDTREQRCWFHKISNVLAALPNSAHRVRRRRSQKSGTPRTSSTRGTRLRGSRPPTGGSSPRRSPRSPTMSRSCWRSTTTRPSIGSTRARRIESTFATVRSRSKLTKGPGSRAAGIAMAYKLIEAAQSRWRAVNAPHVVALVRAGARFENGKLVERPDGTTKKEAAA
jgi:transposase-like protein